MEIKAEIRIPTTQYGYINLNIEVPTIEDAIDIHNNAVELYNKPAVTGLDKKTYDRWSEKYLMGSESMDSVDLENYHKMSPEQVSHIQWAKRTLKRIEAKQITQHND